MIGGGPIGCELAQAFARFGAQVSLLEGEGQILPREDPDAAERVARALSRDGVDLRLGTRVERIERAGAERVIHVISGGVAARAGGATPSWSASAGRPMSRGSASRTSASPTTRARGWPSTIGCGPRTARIYAAGDVCSAHKFTHNSDAQARIVIQNALFLGRARTSALTLPWCTYTDPEVAHVGLSEREAAARGIAVRTFVQELADVDRAVLDGEAEGFVKVHVRAGTDRILGATIVARHAGEMLPELTLAIATGTGLGRIASVIHAYPTQAEAIRKLGDAYNRTRLTPRVKRLFARWLAWTR